MAEFVLTDPFISIAGNDVSEHFTSVALPVEAETQEATAFGDEWRTRLGGLKDWSASLDFNQDFAAGQLDALMWPLIGTNVALVIRPDSAAAGGGQPAVHRQRHSDVLPTPGQFRGRACDRQHHPRGQRAAGAG